MQPNNEAFDCLFINISSSVSLFIFKQKLIFHHVSKTCVDSFISRQGQTTFRRFEQWPFVWRPLSTNSRRRTFAQNVEILFMP